MSRAIPLVAAAGLAMGYACGPGPLRHAVDPLLLVLLFLVGAELGSDPLFWRSARRHGARGALLGLAVLAGSALGAGLAGALAGLDPLLSAAAGAASGWYSLAGPVLVAAAGPYWGLVGLVSNMAREIAAIALVPVLAPRLGSAAVALGGATSMDSTLPVIARSLGPRSAALGMAQGLVVTLLAPLALEALLAARTALIP